MRGRTGRKRRGKRGGRMYKGGYRGGEEESEEGMEEGSIAATKTIEILLRTSLPFDPLLGRWGRC